MALIIGDGLDEFRKKVALATVAVPNWHVGSDNWLEHVLKGLWPQFVALRDEITSDATRITVEVNANYEKWRAHLIPLNRGASDVEIDEEGSAARRWLEARQTDLLPVEYFHVVFTLTRTGRRHRLVQQAGHLRTAVRHRRRDAAHDRR